MTDNEDIESRGCDISQEVPAHYRVVAGQEDKRCFHFNDDRSKRCLCNYDHCNQHVMAKTNRVRYSLKSFEMLNFFKKKKSVFFF